MDQYLDPKIPSSPESDNRNMIEMNKELDKTGSKDGLSGLAHYNGQLGGTFVNEAADRSECTDVQTIML